MSELINQLKSDLDRSGIRVEDEVSDKYSADWSGSGRCKPNVLLRPKSSSELSNIMKLCHAHGQAVVIQGGLTGLAGGATPKAGEFAISLERMDGIEELDTESMTMTALAGTPLQTLQQAAAANNLFLPLDLGARGSCSIGGNIATNAGGTEVIRYGMARSMVLGLEVVLADGTIVSSMNKMIKNNAGYDLKQLFIGTEGTLGIITRIVIQLQPKSSHSHTALCAIKQFNTVPKLLSHFKNTLGPGLTGFELMWHNYYNKVLNVIPTLRNPFSAQHAYYLLIEYQNNDLKTGHQIFESTLFEQIESGLIADAVVAQSQQDSELFWSIRDGIGELLQILGPVSNQDISLPINAIDQFAKRLESELTTAYQNIEVLLFGHIGDNNLHVCAYNGSAEDKVRITHDIMRITGELSGAISAEHGIGTIKKEYLHLTRSDQEIALMKTIKHALDPKGILNPGRVI